MRLHPREVTYLSSSSSSDDSSSDESTTTLGNTTRMGSGDIGALPAENDAVFDSNCTPVFYAPNQSVTLERCVDLFNQSDESCAVIGANLRGLLLALCHKDNRPSSQYTCVFFTHFRSFCESQKLLQFILQQYKDSNNSEDREHVLVILSTWLRDYWDGLQDCTVLDDLSEFMYSISTSDASKQWQELRSILNWHIRSKQLPPSHTSLDIVEHSLRRNKAGVPAVPIVSDTLLSSLLASPSIWDVPVLEFDPEELARQLTLCENALFCAIEPFELLYPAGPGQGDQYTASSREARNVREMTSLSTQLTYWISECILREKNLKQRIQILRFFILFGEAGYKLQNYNLLMAVLGALGSSNIQRLKKTWNGLSARKINKFEFLSELMNPARNFATYRACLRNVEGPALPFLGLILTDITFAKDGNPVQRAFPGKGQLINLVRFYKLSKFVRQFQAFQTPYDFSPVPEIQSFLCGIRDVGRQRTQSDYLAGSEQLYTRSLELEPRESSLSARVKSSIDASRARSPSSRMFARTLTVLRSPYESLSLGMPVHSDAQRHTLT